MKLVQLLENRSKEIIDRAAQSVLHARLRHYETNETEENRRRLERLYSVAVECVKQRDLIPMLEYAREVARERYPSHYDLQEVQTVFNLLEEEVWKRITEELRPADYPESFGLISTVLGAGKQALAAEYVALASHRNEEAFSIDLNALSRVL